MLPEMRRDATRQDHREWKRPRLSHEQMQGPGPSAPFDPTPFIFHQRNGCWPPAAGHQAPPPPPPPMRQPELAAGAPSSAIGPPLSLQQQRQWETAFYSQGKSMHSHDNWWWKPRRAERKKAPISGCALSSLEKGSLVRLQGIFWRKVGTAAPKAQEFRISYPLCNTISTAT